MISREINEERSRLIQEAMDETKAMRERIKELESKTFTAHELKKVIGTADMDTLIEISALCRARHRQLLQAAANKFYAGQDVSFIHEGVEWTGIISKINRKSLSIITHKPVARKWKVSPNFCRPEDR